MKKILMSALVFAGILGFTSCEKFLAEEPRSSLTSVDYYQTEQQIYENVNTLYRSGAPSTICTASGAYYCTFVANNNILTGYYTNSYEGQETVCLYSRLLTRQQYVGLVSQRVDDIWDDCYQAINIANGVIQYAPDIEFSSYDQNTLIGEAKFFRAFNYFLLVKNFQAVPLSTSFISDLTDNMYPSRTPVDEIYALIEEDLQYAVENLPATKFYSNKCRIGKYVAAQTLADVYMQQGKYSEAIPYLQIVLNSGHSLLVNNDTGLNSAYNQLRTVDGSDEIIYGYEFDGSISNGGRWPCFSVDGSAVNCFDTYVIFERTCGVTAQFLNVYDSNDLRVQDKQFFAWSYDNAVTGATWTCNVDSDGNSLPGMWYWFDEDAMLYTGIATKDRDMYRYAETLIDAAECIAQTSGVTAEAAGYLAQIKARALLGTEADLTASLQSLSKDEFIQECWNERLREFPAEFKIWDQCLRTNMFPEISKTTPGEVEYVNLVGATNGSGATFKESDLYWPMSLNEMQRNPNLEQSEGWY